MTIQPVSTSEYTTANREWLASLHGTDSVDTITLDLNLFCEGTDYVCGDGCHPYGRVLSGVPVGRVAESGPVRPVRPGGALWPPDPARLHDPRDPVRSGADPCSGRAAVARRGEGVEGAGRYRRVPARVAPACRADPLRVSGAEL